MSQRSLRKVFLAGFAASLCVVFSSRALAHVGSGGNCAACHGSTTDREDVRLGTTLPNHLAVSPRLDAGGNTSLLKSFTVYPGDTIPITIDVTGSLLESGTEYGVALTGTLKGSPLSLESLTSLSTVKGVQTSLSDLLSFTADPNPDWVTSVASPTSSKVDNRFKTYFAQGPFLWDGTPMSYTYNLKVNSDTLPDVYSLTFRAAGVDSGSYGTGGSKWAQGEEFLLNVVAVPEPSAIVLLLTAGFGSLFYLLRRKK